MQRSALLVLGIATACAIGGAVAPHTAPFSRPTPVLVELFTSEGCSSCPPADTLLQQLADTQPVANAEAIVLEQHVDYWDQLGWKDRFSSAALTARQRAYSRAFSSDSIYTPQMVVDGRSELVGSDAGAARRAIAKAASMPHATVSLAIETPAANRVAVSATATDLPEISRRDRAEILVAVVEDGLRSQVRAGENSGHLLTHTAVVRSLTIIGEGKPAATVRADVALAPDWQRDHVRIVAFVQERASRRVLGAASMALPGAHR